MPSSSARAASRRQAEAQNSGKRAGPRLGEQWGQQPLDWWSWISGPEDWWKRADEELVPGSVTFTPYPTLGKQP